MPPPPQGIVVLQPLRVNQKMRPRSFAPGRTGNSSGLQQMPSLHKTVQKRRIWSPSSFAILLLGGFPVFLRLSAK
jgi:hypothetical protein